MVPSSAAASTQVAVVMLPPPPIMPLALDPSDAPDVLGEALSALTRLRDDLQGADPRLVVGRLELILGWLQADSSVMVAWGQAQAAVAEGKKGATEATEARDAALADAASTKDSCSMVEAELKALREEQATRARRLQEQEEELKACEATLAIAMPSWPRQLPTKPLSGTTWAS